MKKVKKKSHSIWEALSVTASRFDDASYPKVSVIVPTYNCPESVPPTLESILEQDYPDFEVIVIDATSTDRTVEVVQSYKDDKLKLFSVSHFQPYEMLNKGISLATGSYVNFITPGDFYLYHLTLRHVMSVVLDTKEPGLVYSGCLIRDHWSEVKLLFRPLTLEYLKQGQQPTSLESCWFHRDTFKHIGKFNALYSMRGGFDLFCRFMKEGSLSYAFTTRVLTDYDVRTYKKKDVLTHFKETLHIIWYHFGTVDTLKWLSKQKDLKRLVRLWLRSLRVAFFGRV